MAHVTHYSIGDGRGALCGQKFWYSITYKLVGVSCKFCLRRALKTPYPHGPAECNVKSPSEIK